MKILCVGDVFGRAGRKIFQTHTRRLKEKFGIDLVIVNGENAAGGKGITAETFLELVAAGADVITGGNHIFDKNEGIPLLEREPYLLRPANYPEGAPGKGYAVFPYKAKNIGVINLSGRTFMPPLDCPFQKADEILKTIAGDCDIIVVDFHAEATSEKLALAHYLDGRAQVVVGTHTHVQTADERLLPHGTAYITDLGMTGPKDSILGVDKDIIVKKFLLNLPCRFEPAKGTAIYSGAVVELDDRTNQAVSIERLFFENL